MTDFSNLIEWAKDNGPVSVNVEAHSVTFQFHGSSQRLGTAYNRALVVWNEAIKGPYSAISLRPTAKGTKLEVRAK